MMNSEPIDLSPLDAASDAERWRRNVEQTLSRIDPVLAQRRASSGALGLIASWERPLLAAAAIAVLVMVPVEVVLERHETRRERIASLVALSTRAVHAESPPSGSDLLRALSAGGAK